VLHDAAVQLERMTADFTSELAVVWPVTRGRLDRPVLAAAGDADHVGVMPSSVFRCGLQYGTQGVVLAHNHRRSTGPSGADLAVTRRLVAAGHVLGIPLLAHLVVEPGGVHDVVSGTTFTLVH